MGQVVVPWINQAWLQQENVIFLEILEQIFSKMYHKMQYIFLKFIWKYNKYIVYYFSNKCQISLFTRKIKIKKKFNDCIYQNICLFIENIMDLVG